MVDLVKDILDARGGISSSLAAWRDMGGYDASVNTFPTTGGSASGGAIKDGDTFDITTAGTLGGVSVEVGATIRALTNTPGQTLSNWRIDY